VLGEQGGLRGRAQAGLGTLELDVEDDPVRLVDDAEVVALAGSVRRDGHREVRPSLDWVALAMVLP